MQRPSVKTAQLDTNTSLPGSSTTQTEGGMLPTLLTTMEKIFNIKEGLGVGTCGPRSVPEREVGNVECDPVVENSMGGKAILSWSDVIPALPSIGGNSKATIVEQKLIALKRPQVSSRYHAAEDLASLGPAAVLAVPGLCKAMHRDRSALVRKSCALALGEIGSEKSVSDLEYTAMHDEDKFVRQRAEQALEKFGLELVSV